MGSKKRNHLLETTSFRTSVLHQVEFIFLFHAVWLDSSSSVNADCNGNDDRHFRWQKEFNEGRVSSSLELLLRLARCCIRLQELFRFHQQAGGVVPRQQQEKRHWNIFAVVPFMTSMNMSRNTLRPTAT